ncbi:MAG: hypothetical protein RLZZ568_1158 [Cyanobacteriota bacterium]|jgi:hypothetical protein
MRTGILDYPAQWLLPQPVPSAASKPKSLPALPEARPPIVNESAKSAAVQSPQGNSSAVSQPVNNVKVIINTDELPLSAAPEVKIPERDLEDTPLLGPLESLESRRQTLLTEQEMERRLFYLFAEELERTGDLRKFPVVLRSTSHS